MTNFPEVMERPVMDKILGMPQNTVRNCTSFMTVEEWD